MNAIRAKLSFMMFLEFFIWGAWFPLIFGYLPNLGFGPFQQSLVLNTFAVASFVGMFFSNQFADRNFAAERFLAVSHLIGGIAILALGWVTNFWLFLPLMLVHTLFYVPTISITNAVAFANLKDPQHDFGPVRLWGTIGWIAASWPFVFILLDWAAVPPLEGSFITWLGEALGKSKTGAALDEGVRWTFITAGLASLLLSAFSLTLPHTPPKPARSVEETLAWLEASRLLAVPFILVLFIVTFFDSAVHQGYFLFTNDFLKSVGVKANWVMTVMTIGQVAEIGTMAFLGTCLKKLGWRTTMVIGILGHALRFSVFALLPIKYLAITVILVHGICYAFFFATVYIFVDEFLPKNARSSAQGLFNFLILGLGIFVANIVWPFIANWTKPAEITAQVDPIRNVVVVKGYIHNLAADDGKLTVTMSRTGESESTESSVALDPKSHTFSVDAGPAEVGKYSFKKIPIIVRQVVVGDKKADLALPDLEIKDNYDRKAPPKVTAFNYDFQKLFLFPAGVALLASLFLAAFFRPPERAAVESEVTAVLPH